MKQTKSRKIPTKAIVLLVVTFGVFAGNAGAADPSYLPVEPPQPTQTPGQIELVDVFWYGCGHCWKFLPFMEKYLGSAPSGVVVRRMPAVSRKSWEVHARAFYAAQQLGVEAKLHRPIFEAIHKDKLKLDSDDALMAFFASHGVANAEFRKVWNSSSVEVLIGKSLQMQGRYGVEGTPSVIINGKYRTSATLAGGYENLIKVIEELVEQER